MANQEVIDKLVKKFSEIDTLLEENNLHIVLSNSSAMVLQYTKIADIRPPIERAIQIIFTEHIESEECF